MQNIWTGKQVRVADGTRVRLWDAAEQASTMIDHVGTDVYTVASATACSTTAGGGSQLTLTQAGWEDDYTVYVHSSAVAEVA